MTVSVESVITRHLPGWPQGDPGELRAAANCWTAVAGGVRTLTEDSHSRIGALSASWQGGAKTAFEQEWTNLGGAVYQGCDELCNVANALHQAADKLENAQHAYEVAIGAAAVTAVVGIAATFITFGASDEVSAEAVAGDVAAAAEVAAEATAAASSALSALATIAQQMVARFVVFLGVDLTAQAGIGAVVYPDHNPFGHLNFDSALSVAAGMAIPGLPVGSGLAKIAAGGVAGATADALAQEITTGKIDPGEILFNGALGAAGAAALVGGGKLAALRSLRNLDDPRLVGGTPEYESYTKELSLDPAKGWDSTPATRQEAAVAVRAEAEGKIPGPLTRAPLGEGGLDEGDFIDSTGQHWEVKSSPDTIPSYRPMAGAPNPNVQSMDTFTKMINKELALGNKVLIDPIAMSEGRLAQLREIVASNPAWKGRVIWGS